MWLLNWLGMLLFGFVANLCIDSKDWGSAAFSMLIAVGYLVNAAAITVGETISDSIENIEIVEEPDESD